MSRTSEQLSRDTVRNTSVFAIFTMLSRGLGLVRDMLKAFAFGTGILSVAFDIAFRLPNMLRNLVAEGALTQSFIPLYEQHKDKAGSERQAAGVVIVFFGLGLSALAVVGWFALPYIIPFMTNDPSTSHRGTALTIKLAQILFPYIVFISMTSIYHAIQYSHGTFWAGSIGPALMNGVIIVSFSAFYFLQTPRSEADVYAWSLAIMAAAIVQLVFQIAIVRRLGISPKYSFSFRHPIIPGLFALMLPATFGAAVQEIGQLVDIFLATSLRNDVPGAIAALSYSHRMIQLPMGVFGVAVATASLPQLSRLFNEKKLDDFQASLANAISLNAFLLLPASLGLIFFAQPIISLLFQRGVFDARSTEITAFALKFYAIGILGYSLQKLFMSALYAQKNARVPAIITAVVLVLNISVSVSLMPFLLHGGLALGSAIAAYVGAAIYIVVLTKKDLMGAARKKLPDIARLVTLNVVFAGGLAALAYSLAEWRDYVQILIAVPAAVLVYFGLAKVLAVPEFQLIRDLLRKRVARETR